MENNIVFIPIPLSQLEILIQGAVCNALKSDNVVNSQLLNSEDVMRLCQISHTTLQKWRDNNKIPFIKEGNKILYNKADVLNALYGLK